MKWSEERLRVLAEEGWSDQQIAELYHCTPKAVASARRRLDIPTHRRCQHCGQVWRASAAHVSGLRLCRRCLDRAVLIYLASEMNVTQLARVYGVGATTLKHEARARYGITRQDVTYMQRELILEQLRSSDVGDRPAASGSAA